jgi:uncharacterized protein (DUF58 family)
MSQRRALGAGGLGLALFAVGLLFGIEALLVPAIGLLGLTILGGLWVWASWRTTTLRRARGAARIVEGDEYPLGIEIGRRIPIAGGELTDPVLEQPVAVGPRRPKAIVTGVRFSRRGRHRLDSTRLTLRDPLGLWQAELRTPAAGELLVLPRVELVSMPGVEPVGAGAGAGQSMLDATSTGGREARAVEFEIDGLRPYRHGTPASRIHWPSVARGGEMVERRLVAGSDAAPLIVLDSDGAPDLESLDAAVRATASLCVHLARHGGCAVLLPGERRPTLLDTRLRRWPAVHAALALVEPGRSAPRGRGLGRGRYVFWVSGGARSAADHALTRIGPSGGVVVAPRDGAHAAFEVAGCTASAWGSRRSVKAAA